MYLLQNYDNDPDFNDQLAITQRSIDSVHLEIQDNIQKLQSNQQNFEIIHHKTQELQNLSSKFNEGATHLKR